MPGAEVQIKMAGRIVGAHVERPSDVPDNVTVRQGRWIPVIGGLLTGSSAPAAAVTLGRTIIVHPAARVSSRLLRHELAHVEQWRRSPLTFPLRYAWQHLKHGYRDNPFEVEARAAEHVDS